MTLTKTFQLFVILSLLLLISTGCSRLPLTGKLPGNLVAEKISTVDDASPFAISPDGTVIACLHSGLKLVHLPTKELQEIPLKRAGQLAWSPLGSTLAATFYEKGESTIILFDQHGIQVAETVVAGDVTSLDWLSESELLAAALSITNYSFGSNYKSILYRWQPGSSLPVTQSLRDTTLQPSTMAMLQRHLAHGSMLDVYSPAGQILYMHPNDPPLFSPYYKLILRDLTTDREQELATPGFNSSGGRFFSDGKKVIYSDGNSQTFILSPFNGVSPKSVRTPGANLAVAPVGDYWFADGTLYQGESVVALLAPGGVARFSQDGRQLIIAVNGELYRLFGL